MFPSLLRRPRNGPRRVDVRDESVSPSPGPATRRYTARRRATADFTEADDDQDSDNAPLRPLDEDGNTARDDAAADADEDGARALPVLPLFSATHLGLSSASICSPLHEKDVV